MKQTRCKTQTIPIARSLNAIMSKVKMLYSRSSKIRKNSSKFKKMAILANGINLPRLTITN